MRSIMNKYIVRICSGILILTLTVTACGAFKTSQTDAAKGTDSTSADNLQQQSLFGSNTGYGSVLAAQGIEAPVSRPSIYVDAAGYVTEREKKVLFVGDKHGKTFDVIRSSDKAVVYTGRIPIGTKDELSGLTFSVGDFTMLEEPGTYYIYTDIVGQSYPFTIADDTYENLFLNMLKNVSDANMEESPKGVCDVSFGMHVIMYALQCNGALFEAAYEHLAEDEQDKQLLAQLLYMAKWLISQQESDGSMYGDYEATAAFCGIMVMSRDSFGKYDARVDREYMQAAESAWNWLEAQGCDTDVRKSARFYAAAQFFKAEGKEQYKTLTEEFLKEKKEDYSSERFVFYGVLSYISAEKGTDRDLCTYIMKDMVARIEHICEEAKKDTFFGIGTRTIESNMSNMLHLSFVNYLTPSKEYTVIIENTIQYIGGLNENGICYMGADGIWQNTEATYGRSFEWNGIMLLGMSDMLKNFSEIE